MARIIAAIGLVLAAVVVGVAGTTLALAQENPRLIAAGALFQRGYNLQEAGRHRDAIDSYLAGLQLVPDQARPHYDIARSYEALGDRAAALRHYQEAARLGAGSEVGRLAAARLNAQGTTGSEQTLAPGTNFRDCSDCPVMVVIPPGEFIMGSPDSEQGRDSDEGPQRRVTIGYALAIGKFEVTFGEWDACVAGGGCSHRPSDQGWGRGNRPVVDVSWHDAKQFVAWLSAKTGRTYRLLSEAEWEYAARGGTATAYYWGNTVGSNNTNCSECGSAWGGKQSALVGSFAANAFGLHDMLGNVYEWTEDCWNTNYNGAPNDSVARTSGNCRARMLRGGSWGNSPQYLRSAVRFWNSTGTRLNAFGFRVARTLP